MALVVLSLLHTGCATVNSPKGGPVDSLPPRVVLCDPAPYTVNFAGKKITITFNEYVQLKDQQKLFFMSPASKRRPQLSIKGRSVVVEFRDSLDANTTYRLDFGSSIVDNNESNKLDGYSFVFSTGDQIDSLMMAGQVIDAATQDTLIGAFINYFDARADSSRLDSLMYLSRAEAVFRTDSSGYFVADILKEKPYRVYAFLDNNGDQRYQAGADMVAFLDSTYNPVDMPPFSFEYDSVKKRMQIEDMQLRFELFTEKGRFRQNFVSHSRTGRNKLNLAFATPEVHYDSLLLTGVDTTWLIKESNTAGDSISYWIAPPTVEQFKTLPDSISGTFVYERQDSAFRFFPKKEKLNFYSKTFVPKEDKKAKKDTTVQEVVKNPFGFKVQAAQSLNPETGIVFDFDFPLRKLDSARVKLTRIEIDQKSRQKEPPKILTDERFHFDSVSMRRYVLRAPWKVGADYELMIPDSVFVDITFSANDTLSSKFAIADPDKFGAITLEMAADTSDKNNYIVELAQGRGKNTKIAKRETRVAAGDKIMLKYLTPGEYMIRITRDENHNGKWDTGRLDERVYPERVRMHKTSSGGELIQTKENWEIVEKIDLGKLFER